MSYPAFAHIGFKLICTGMFLFTAKYMHVATVLRDIQIGLLQILNK